MTAGTRGKQPAAQEAEAFRILTAKEYAALPPGKKGAYTKALNKQRQEPEDGGPHKRTKRTKAVAGGGEQTADGRKRAASATDIHVAAAKKSKAARVNNVASAANAADVSESINEQGRSDNHEPSDEDSDAEAVARRAIGARGKRKQAVVASDEDEEGSGQEPEQEPSDPEFQAGDASGEDFDGERVPKTMTRNQKVQYESALPNWKDKGAEQAHDGAFIAINAVEDFTDDDVDRALVAEARRRSLLPPATSLGGTSTQNQHAQMPAGTHSSTRRMATQSAGGSRIEAAGPGSPTLQGSMASARQMSNMPRPRIVTASALRAGQSRSAATSGASTVTNVAPAPAPASAAATAVATTPTAVPTPAPAVPANPAVVPAPVPAIGVSPAVVPAPVPAIAAAPAVVPAPAPASAITANSAVIPGVPAPTVAAHPAVVPAPAVPTAASAGESTQPTGQWPADTDVKSPEQGHTLMKAQTPRVRKVLKHALKTDLPHKLFFENTYPQPLERPAFFRAVMVSAAEAEEEEAIAARLRVDREYAAAMSKIPEARMSNLRGKMKDAADAAVRHAYGIDQYPPARHVHIIKWLVAEEGRLYIFPGDAAMSTYNEDLPFCHDGIVAVIRAVFFSPKAATRFDTALYCAGHDGPQLPDAMVASSAAAVEAGLRGYLMGCEPVKVDFSGTQFVRAYLDHMSTLRDLKEQSVLAYNALMGGLYLRVTGNVAGNQAHNAAIMAPLMGTANPHINPDAVLQALS
ncbi:hypothetical protein FA95DRAFT_1611280 [Auriscalpium vulgare]|uniref:Uncharacterized protein n=1 Tax=Auriscalpium vulgare TaxID=40419 RepID=A0ACB8RC03_9AGAM|nr:hypothetical protein FA95DRAFT_1611280 [Auriscalpium vulgare]